MPTFAARLKRSRKAAGLTQSELANLTQVHRASVQRWEAGGDMPSALTMTRLAATLGVSVMYLLCMRNTQERPAYLAQDERKLLELYRGLPPQARSVLLASARDLLQAHKATSREG